MTAPVDKAVIIDTMKKSEGGTSSHITTRKSTRARIQPEKPASDPKPYLDFADSLQASVRRLREPNGRDYLSGEIIGLDPALPCGKLIGREQCGNPAKAALAWQGPTPGQWALLPMCRECVELTARLYKDEEPSLRGA